MNSSLAKKPASVIRTYTQQVRDHSAAMERARDHYFDTLKRAENQYFETIKRITDAVAQATTPPAEVSETETPPPTQ
jgi:hypothetical protein